MTAADQIAADLRDAFRRIELPRKPHLVVADKALDAVCQANDFDAGLTRALAAIVALADAEHAAAAEVRAAQARQKVITDALHKAREALRVALEACGGPGAATVQTEHHTARLQRGGVKVEITNPDALSEIYWRYKKEPDKALINAMMAKGDAIPGAALVQSPPTLHISAKDKS
jgi:hypothetical protein